MTAFLAASGNFKTPGVNTVFLSATKTSQATVIVVRTKPHAFILVNIAKNKFNALLRSSLKLTDPQAKMLASVYKRVEMLPHLKTLLDFPGVFSVKGPITMDQLHNTLVVKSDMSEVFFDRLFRTEENTTPAKPTSKLGKAVIYMPDNMQPSRKKNVNDLLLGAKKSLAKKDLDWLITNGKIKVTTLKGNTAGLYTRGTEEITIDSKGHSLKEGVLTILHELSHKLVDRSMKPAEVALIEKTYKQFIGEADTVDFDRLVKLILPGTGTGFKNKFYRFVHLEDPRIQPGWYALQLKKNAAGKWAQVSTPPQGPFTEKQLRANFVTPSMPSKWFPTEYSRKNADEFFAELFSYWLEGKLEKLPAAWVDRVTKPYQRKG